MSVPELAATEVDVAALRTVAGAVDQAAETLGAAERAGSGRLAVPSQSGWASATAARSAAEAWAAHLRALTAAVDGFARHLAETGQRYAAADQRSAQNVGGAGRGPR